MNIFNYCTKTGRFFYFPADNDVYAIRYDQYRQKHNWTLLKNNYRVGDFDWGELVAEIENLPGISQYL